VGKLKPVSFIYDDDTSSTTRYGFIAEDTAAVDSHLATYDQQGKLSGVDDRALLAIIISAIQQIEKTIADFADHFNSTKELTFTRATGDKIDVKTVNAQKLCLDDVCVTKDQLQAMLQGAGQSAASQSSPPPTAASDQPQASSTPDTTATTPPETEATTDASSTPTVSDAPSIVPTAAAGSSTPAETFPFNSARDNDNPLRVLCAQPLSTGGAT